MISSNSMRLSWDQYKEKRTWFLFLDAYYLASENTHGVICNNIEVINMVVI